MQTAISAAEIMYIVMTIQDADLKLALSLCLEPSQPHGTAVVALNAEGRSAAISKGHRHDVREQHSSLTSRTAEGAIMQ